MPHLAERLWAEDRRQILVQDFTQLTESLVAARRGLKGLGLKTSFAMLKSVRPNAVPRALEVLLPQFAQALDPLFQEFMRDGGKIRDADFSRFLQRHARRAVDAMLSVTDARVDASRHKSLKKIYASLRGSAHDEMLEVLPAFANLLSRIE